MYLDGLHYSNLPRHNDHPKCTILENDTIFMDIIFNNYFQESFLEDVICENYSSGRSKSIKSTFTVSIYLMGSPSVLKIFIQRVTYDTTTGEAIKKDLKVSISLEFLYKKHQVLRRYHTPYCY